MRDLPLFIDKLRSYAVRIVVFKPLVTLSIRGLNHIPLAIIFFKHGLLQNPELVDVAPS
jgi:hypothetical protein